MSDMEKYVKAYQEVLSREDFNAVMDFFKTFKRYAVKDAKVGDLYCDDDFPCYVLVPYLYDLGYPKTQSPEEYEALEGGLNDMLSFTPEYIYASLNGNAKTTIPYNDVVKKIVEFLNNYLKNNR